MATFENTVMIRRPIEDVFAFLSDFENVPKWNYAIVETRKVSEGAVGVGTIYHQVRSVPSRSEERFEVTAYNPPPPSGDTRPTRAVPVLPLLCPGRHCRGNPGHELGRARTTRPWPSARASRRATCPGRRGGQPPEAQGAAGGIAVGHIGAQPDASPLKGRFRGLTVQVSRRPRPAERLHLQPGLASDRRQGVVDRAATCAAGVGG